jgi:hypothetical protein
VSALRTAEVCFRRTTLQTIAIVHQCITAPVLTITVTRPATVPVITPRAYTRCCSLQQQLEILHIFLPINQLSH